MRSYVKIAIIDNGVNDTILNEVLEHNIFIDKHNICQVETKNLEYQKSQHGTNCAMIIKNYCKDCTLSSVRILDKEGKGLVDKLQPALKWCYANKINIVNLSLGTTHFVDKNKVRKMINHYANRGSVKWFVSHRIMGSDLVRIRYENSYQRGAYYYGHSKGAIKTNYFRK